ncbi:MAG: efflux RND transporter periplasmic adaptor subunit [Sedimentisphaerales bacterium]|nr:efflux RND transporter periplasmic adaptor subunit [Sedimentisphaerales bacterium]
MKKEKIANSDIAQTLGLGQHTVRRRRLKRWLIVILIAATALILGIRGRTHKPNSVQFKTEEVRRGDLTIIVSATGTLEPTNEVEVGSELSGIVKSVEVDYNDKVKVDQILARLDISKLQAEVTQSKAALKAAEAKVLQAKATVNETRNKLLQLQKVRELSNNKVPSQLDLDAAEAAFERAKADEASAVAAVSQAKATLDTFETDLYKADIRSPIDGVVLTRDVEPGQTVAAAFQAPVLFSLAEDLTQMELHVDVDEADIGQVREGQQAVFTVDAYPNRRFEAQIIQIRYGSQTVDGVVTYETVLKVDNSDLSLRPGMTATADITVKKVENAILVPNGALRFTPPVQEEQVESDGNLLSKIMPHPPHQSKQREEINTDKTQQRVWVLQDGQPVAVPISIDSTDGTSTEVVEGDINPGMAVIVDTMDTNQ